MRGLEQHEAVALTWMAAIAGVTIILTAFMLRPVSCVDEKARNLELVGKIADIKTQRAVIEPGVCVAYESLRQKVCRYSVSRGGKLYLTDLTVDGEMEKTDE